jgi:hypothetical protein
MKNKKIRTALEGAYGIYLDEEMDSFDETNNPDSVYYVLMPEKFQKEIVEKFGKGNEDVANLKVKAFILEKMHKWFKGYVEN